MPYPPPFHMLTEIEAKHVQLYNPPCPPSPQIFKPTYGTELHWQKSDEAQQDVLFPHIWSITILLLDIILSRKSLFLQSFVYFMISLYELTSKQVEIIVICKKLI